MKLRAVVLVLVAIVGLCAPASAQLTQGRLAGTVTDAQGAILPGVSVTVTSPSLIGGQNTVTQSDGKYMFPSLPSGTYRVLFELSGFQKLTRENVSVVLGQTLSDCVPERECDGDWRFPSCRRDDDEGGHGPQGRRPDCGPDLHRCVGRALDGARHQDAGLRRRRQP